MKFIRFASLPRSQYLEIESGLLLIVQYLWIEAGFRGVAPQLSERPAFQQDFPA